jgi:hypothetical protein
MLRGLRQAVRIQRHLGSSVVVEEEAAALARAHPDDDEAAAAALRPVVRAEPDGARTLIERFSLGRESPSTDRIVRLVTAALNDAPVVPISPEHAALYTRLDALVRMPIGDAFRQLAEGAPELDRLAASVDPCPAAASEDDTQAMAWNMAWRRRLARVVGPRSGHTDPVLRTTRMEQLALAYLRIAAGDATGGDATTSYRDWHRRELDHRVRAGYVEVGRDERTGRTWQSRSGRFF